MTQTLSISSTDTRCFGWPDPPRGGMHVGFSRGVRCVHLPTGISVAIDLGRSQHLARSVALPILAALVDAHLQRG